jgi:hypothetical protein
VAAILMLGACSASGDSDPSQSPSDQSGTAMTIIVDDSGRVHEWTLTCDPDGGKHPDPQGACAFLDLATQWGQDPFAPVPNDQVCAEIYGGPQTATVKGLWDGNKVDAQFSRVNSCEIERWSNAIRLLVIDGGA